MSFDCQTSESTSSIMISQVFLIAALATVSFANGFYPEHHAPKPYKFGYSIKDKHGEQHREESGTGGHVTGSYGFTDDRGIHRQVNYVADHGGFRAQVKTNEPGTANQNPAAVHLVSSAPHTGQEGFLGVPAAVAGYGYGGLGYGQGLGLNGAYNGYGGAYNGYGGAYNGYGGAYNGYGGAYDGYGGAYGGYGGYGLGILGGLGYARYGY